MQLNSSLSKHMQLVTILISSRMNERVEVDQLCRSSYLTDSSPSGPGEWWGDGGDPVGLLLLPRGCVRSCVPGRPALPPPAAREQQRPRRPAEELPVGPRWGVAVWRKRKKIFFDFWFFSSLFIVHTKGYSCTVNKDNHILKVQWINTDLPKI